MTLGRLHSLSPLNGLSSCSGSGDTVGFGVDGHLKIDDENDLDDFYSAIV